MVASIHSTYLSELTHGVFMVSVILQPCITDLLFPRTLHKILLRLYFCWFPDSLEGSSPTDAFLE
jgi:hypothetical protein